MAERVGKLKLRNDGDGLELTRDDNPAIGYRVGLTPAGIPTRSRYVFQFSSIVAPSASVQVGTFDYVFQIPDYMAGHEVLTVAAQVDTVGAGAGDTLIQILRRRAAADVAVLSEPVHIEPTGVHSDDAATQPVVNVANDDLAARDALLIQVTQVPGTTAPLGLSLWIHTELP